MAGRIPREFIDDLLARADIVELIDSRVRLKKAGRNYQACCPFHNEKTPSFTVSQEKQFYHCFGCGEHGNAISFLMEYDRLEFPEAVEELARMQGVEVPREQGGINNKTPQQKQQLTDDYQLMQQVSQYFAQQLKGHPNKQRPIDYLKSRGLSGEVAKRFELGYAPDAWDSLLAAFGKTPQLQQQLLDLKLITENDKRRRFDFFRDRIVFPIRDKRGRVIGFGGRVLGDGTPKYLNSPETRIFQKGHELYGFYQARQANRRLDKVLIVEGYMDVVALAQFDINYAVASLGTATTPEHIQMLVRATSRIICCYDGDRAGRDAAWRAMENALPWLKDGIELQFLFLPDGEDPDTQVRKLGKEAFEQSFEQAVPLSQFFFDRLLTRHNVGSIEGKASLKSEAIPLLEKIAGDNQRDLLMSALSQLTGEQDQFQRQQDIARANQRKKPRNKSHQHSNKTQMSPVRMLIKLLLEQPKLAADTPHVDPTKLPTFDAPGMDLLCELYQYCLHKPDVKVAAILEHFRQHPHGSHLGKLLAAEHVQQNIQQVYQDSFAKLLEWQIDSRRQQLLSQSSVSGLSTEEKQELNMLLKAKY